MTPMPDWKLSRCENPSKGIQKTEQIFVKKWNNWIMKSLMFFIAIAPPKTLAILNSVFIVVYSNAIDQVNSLVYDGFVEEIVNTLELSDEVNKLSVSHEFSSLNFPTGCFLLNICIYICQRLPCQNIYLYLVWSDCWILAFEALTSCTLTISFNHNQTVVMKLEYLSVGHYFHFFISP